MKVSKKLSIVQLLLVVTQIVLLVVSAVQVISIVNSAKHIDFWNILKGASIVTAVYFAITVIIVVIGVLQILYKIKEKTSTIYLLAGISTVASIVPLIGYLASLAALVFNIIGAIKNK